MKKETRVGKTLFQKMVLGFGFTALLFGILSVTENTFALDPTELQPASPMKPGVFELEGKLKYDSDDGDYELETETSLEYSFTRRFALRLLVPADFPEHEDNDIGDVEVRGKYVLNPDAVVAPLFVVTAAANLPTGDESSGVDWDLRLRVSKRIGNFDFQPKLHANLVWKYNNDYHHDQRLWRYRAVLGYSQLIGKNTTLYTDVFREELKHEGKHANMFEVGFKHKLGKATTLALGAGAGFGSDSPDWRSVLGIQFKFGGK
jgi:hypothetical protein